MSGSTDTTPASFTDAQKTDIRRYCGYPAYGAGAAGFQGWRFFQAYGLLEFRMNNLSAAEASVVMNYLTTLRALECGVTEASGRLDTAEAAVWTRNPYEVARARRPVRRLATATVRLPRPAARPRPR